MKYVLVILVAIVPGQPPAEVNRIQETTLKECVFEGEYQVAQFKKGGLAGDMTMDYKCEAADPNHD